MERSLKTKLWILFCLLVLILAGGLYYHSIWYLGHRTWTLSLAGRPITFQDLRWSAAALSIPILWMVQVMSLTDLSRIQRLLGVGLRSLLLLLITAALCRPVQKREHSKVCTVVLVDLSASVSDAQLAEARRSIQKVLDHKGDNLVRVVGFSSRPKVIEPKGGHLPPLSRPPAVDGAVTNLQAGIQLALSLYPADTIGRMLVLSDGLQTRGDAITEAYRAADAKIPIYHMAFSSPGHDEILIKELKLPDKVEIGKPFEVTAEVYSNQRARVRISLQHGSAPDDMFWNELKPSQTVLLHPGRNVVTFPSVIQEPGLVAYVARMHLLDGAKDRIRENNRAAAIMTIKDKPRILIVDGGRRGHLDLFAQALRREDFRVDVRGRYGLPSSTWGLKKFQCVILSDVPVSAVTLTKMRAIEQYVRQFGGCFIMVGGENSFGSGGYGATRIERILPVRLDTERQRHTPYVALVLVIDRSGSMSGRKIELAKEAAKASARVLSGNDLIGVIAFDTEPHPIVRLQRAANRLRISTDIASITSGGGTAVYPALKMAFEWLVPARAKVKHVLLLSDGYSPYGDTFSLVEEMRRRRITASTVGIGGGVDRNLLGGIARRGGGRYYHTNDPANIPKIFVKETREIAKPSIQEGAYTAVARKRADFLQGTGITKVRYFRGYNPTKPKPRAELVLVINPTGEPLLAKWHVGTGQVVAFTTDIKGGWSADWMEQDFAGFQKFWGQLLRSVMRARSYQQFPMKVTARNGTIHVAVDAVDRNDRFLDGLDCTVTVYDWERPGSKRTIHLRQTAAGRYETDFTMPRYGAYVLSGRCAQPYLSSSGKQRKRTVAQTFGSATLTYPREYLLMQPPMKSCVEKPSACPGITLLDRMSQITGGTGLDPSWLVRHPKARRLDLDKALFDPRGRSVTTTVGLWPYFLLLALLVLILDLFVRRIRIFGYRPMRSA